MGDRSIDARDIKQSVVVTGNGNSVALTFGDTGIGLPLHRKQFPPPDRHRRPRPGEPPRELDLLVAEAGRLPLIGRKDLLAELQAWLDDESDISVYGLIGRAGTGKTRLAIEFCRTIDNDPTAKGEWIAGFLSPADLRAVVETLATHSFTWERRTLLVIDYAAQYHRALAHWLDRLAGKKLDTKLRFLLLDREAPEDFGWWQELTVLSPPGRRGLFYALRPKQLPGLSDLEERRTLMAAGLQAARELQSRASGDAPLPAKGEKPDFDRRLAQSQFGNPLNLVMAGVIALDGGPQAALALRRLDAARQLARRELRRMAELADSRHVSADATRHVVAFNELTGGITVADLRKTVADEVAISRGSVDHLDPLLTLLQQELPPRAEPLQQSRLATIQPDLIGEAVVIEAFTGAPSREIEAAGVVRRAYELSHASAAQTLVRLVQDFAYPLEDPNATEKEKATGLPIMGWLLNLAQEIEDPERLVPLADALPLHTTILRESAAELTQRLVAFFRQKAKHTEDSVVRSEAAFWLNGSVKRLSDLGRHEEALSAVKESVGLYRALAEAHSDSFRPALASSLSSYSNVLTNLGRREEALKVIEESVGLYRTLAEARPDALNPSLATGLVGLAGRLADVGRREEALTAAEEAVHLHRALAEVRPEAFEPDLAFSLRNLAISLNDQGRRQEALKAANESVALCRSLVAARPDSYVHELVMSLNCLANILNDLEALIAAEEAVGLCRALAAARPDVFVPDLSALLNNLANRLNGLDRPEEALMAIDEAVRLRRALAEARPDAFTHYLASSLNNLATVLGALGRRKEAVTAAEEAVGLYRALARAYPDAFISHLARSLWVLARLYGYIEKRDLAIATVAEAIELLTPTFVKFPPAVAEVMDGMLQSYRALCASLGREPDMELLGPVVAVLEKFKEREKKE